jgi:hypothetical protein
VQRRTPIYAAVYFPAQRPNLTVMLYWQQLPGGFLIPFPPFGVKPDTGEFRLKAELHPLIIL